MLRFHLDAAMILVVTVGYRSVVVDVGGVVGRGRGLRMITFLKFEEKKVVNQTAYFSIKPDLPVCA